MVNLDDMKAYLRVDFEDDDTLINALLQGAYSYIENCCGQDYKEYPDKVCLADLLVRKLVADEYDNRGTYKDKKPYRDRTTETILELLSN